MQTNVGAGKEIVGRNMFITIVPDEVSISVKWGVGRGCGSNSSASRSTWRRPKEQASPPLNKAGPRVPPPQQFGEEGIQKSGQSLYRLKLFCNIFHLSYGVYRIRIRHRQR